MPFLDGAQHPSSTESALGLITTCFERSPQIAPCRGEIEDDLKSPIRQHILLTVDDCCAFAVPNTFHTGG